MRSAFPPYRLSFRVLIGTEYTLFARKPEKPVARASVPAMPPEAARTVCHTALWCRLRRQAGTEVRLIKGNPISDGQGCSHVDKLLIIGAVELPTDGQPRRIYGDTSTSLFTAGTGGGTCQQRSIRCLAWLLSWSMLHTKISYGSQREK